ncbi:polysaccharide lyase family 7 protein [Pseudomonas turukhanskensis]|uniref:Alginate lyase n=1 Tax=Pseudomonas turukhanskensis TaxID=1806536 RepID=A0A9W6K156_9PSED|nr:polysaccharide lyase family 7 protein [Pseudomonas turukhanskensis]GLK87007.1 alginate lyase [Pseudomonas turukhanskensis]
MIDLATWNLSIPVGVPATTIQTPVLVGGYQDYYFKANNGSVFFWAPVNGTVTESASYPRSELRETFADSKLRNWTYPSADNFLRAAVAVNQVPSTGKVVIGQIHAFGSSKPMVKLEFQYKTKTATANIVAKVRGNPLDEEGQVITVLSGVKLNQRFTYTLHLSPKGALSVTVNSAQWSTRVDPTWAPKLLYFKAGVYTQDNEGYETEAGAATFYVLKIDHTTAAAAKTTK